jgi:hypothetical protein
MRERQETEQLFPLMDFRPGGLTSLPYRFRRLSEQEISHQHNGGEKLELLVLLLGEAVALVVGDEEPDGGAVLADFSIICTDSV